MKKKNVEVLIKFLENKYTKDARKMFFIKEKIIIKKSLPKRMFYFIIFLYIIGLFFMYIGYGIIGNDFKYFIKISFGIFLIHILIYFYYNIKILEIDLKEKKLKTLFNIYNFDDIEKIDFQGNYDLKITPNYYKGIHIDIEGYYINLILNNNKINILSIQGLENTKKTINKLNKILK